MRNLNNKDLMKIMRIVKKADVKNKLIDVKLPRDEEGNVSIDEEQYGTMMILEVIEAVPDAEKEIFSFLADVAGVTAKEMENDEFDLLVKVIEHLKTQDNLISFFKLALGSMNSTK